MDNHLFAGEAHRPAAIPRERLRFTREGWIWLAVVIAMWFIGWLKGINLIVFLAYLLLGDVGIELVDVPASACAALRHAASCPAVCSPTSRPRGRVEVDGLEHKRQNWTLHDASPGHAVAWFVTGESPSEQIRLRAEVTFGKRGTVDCRPLMATSSAAVRLGPEAIGIRFRGSRRRLSGRRSGEFAEAAPLVDAIVPSRRAHAPVASAACSGRRVPRLAIIPARRQPPLDSLAHVGAARN